MSAAQLAELTAISDALGTNEGHSSVDHITALKDKCAALESTHKELMGEAAHDVSEWGAYASEYFQEKWDLKGTVKKWLGRAEGEKK